MESPNIEAPRKPKRKHRLWPWIILLVVIVLPLAAIGYTGIWHIPVVSDAFGSSKPKNLGVKISEAAFQSLTAKVPLKVMGNANTFSVFGEKKYSGSKPSDNVATSEEISSWIEHYTQSDGDISNTQVKFIEGGMEISTLMHRYVNAPIYVKVMVNRTGTQSVALNVTAGKIGNFPVPQKYLKTFSDYAQKTLNEHLAAIPGFSIEQLAYHAGTRHFQGTYPATVESSTGKWW